MVEYVAHRINTRAALQALPFRCGVELDLRDRDRGLILQHDPFIDGEDAEPFFAEYKSRGTMILNIKSERIEWNVLKLVEAYDVDKYFFLDSSPPMIYALTKANVRQVALRLSEFEGIDTVLKFAGRADWVWVDCFTKLILDRKTFDVLKDAGFKIAIVSPELQGRADDIEAHAAALKEQSIAPDIICTKYHNFARWQTYFPGTPDAQSND